MLERTWLPTYAADRVDLGLLAVHRRGAGDPTYRVVGSTHWRAIRTPDGTATLAVTSAGAGVTAQAWGDGAAWALDSLPDLLGEADRPEEWQPGDPLIASLVAVHGRPRFGRSGLVLESLVPSIIEQKVTGQEAFSGFRRLVQRFGEPAPGPGTQHRLRVQPTARTLLGVPSWEWLRLGIDPARSRAVVVAARAAESLERAASLPGSVLESRLRSLPGIGEWTAAEVRQRVLGDPDAVSFGDYHVAKDVGHALEGDAGRDWDDARLREWLEPHRPHRARVVALLYRAVGARPRRGPRLSVRGHLPTS